MAAFSILIKNFLCEIGDGNKIGDIVTSRRRTSVGLCCSLPSFYYLVGIPEVHQY